MLVVVAVWEILAPRRRQTISRAQRWPNNLAIAALNTGLVRIVAPTGVVGFAVIADDQGWGLLHLAHFPDWTVVILAVVLLDLVIYLQHRMLHAVPVLWRLHRMHHADLEFDMTTGVRFHPLEIVLSMGLKIAAVAIVGAPALAVLIFEILLNATSVFNHGNVRVSARIEHALRYFIVTPDMHRVHHSIERAETDSNFGFNLPWWDRLFGTYKPQPAAGHLNMVIGIPAFRAPEELRLDRLLAQPFRHDID
ncbi:MAG: sterol desaturase/sphingolipid hydroxylase (fatty acid hydroxylase superfamily) [Gammaproteobacteria bacterium]|jgi:sterol desaturase/sphingolipid hydroxylase (fatty acid hydroxylase superfamily)